MKEKPAASLMQHFTAKRSGSSLRSVLTDSEASMAQKHVDHFDDSGVNSINIDG